MDHPLSPDTLRALAATALRAGDGALDGMAGATPDLLQRARVELDALAAESGSLSRESEAEQELEAPLRDLVSMTGGVVRMAPPDPEVRRLVHALVELHDRRLVERLERDLSTDRATPELGRLSAALVARATAGERWALRVVRGSARLAARHEVSPRIAPALTWLVLSLHPVSLATLARRWPPPLETSVRRFAEALYGAPISPRDVTAARRALEREVRGDG